jgi:hypothetical protein
MILELRTWSAAMVHAGDRERLHGMPKKYTGWDTHNNETEKVDTELVNDWAASLNSLLFCSSVFGCDTSASHLMLS